MFKNILIVQAFSVNFKHAGRPVVRWLAEAFSDRPGSDDHRAARSAADFASAQAGKSASRPSGPTAWRADGPSHPLAAVAAEVLVTLATLPSPPACWGKEAVAGPVEALHQLAWDLLL